MSELTEQAFRYAVDAHDGQVRKTSDIPYVSHTANVGRSLAQYGYDEEVVAAGFLHDTVEDTDVTLQEIEDEFGYDVAELVDAVTVPADVEEQGWKEAKQWSVDHMKDAPLGAVAIKCADKLDNTRSMRRDYEQMGDELWKYFGRGKDDQQWYAEALLGVFEERLEGEKAEPLYEELEREIEMLYGDEPGSSQRCC